jgi:hypothetical protein
MKTLTDIRGLFISGVKRPERDADDSLPFSADFKTEWSCTSTSPIRLHDMVLS